MDYIAYRASVLPLSCSCSCWRSLHIHVQVKLTEARHLSEVQILHYTILVNVNPFSSSQSKALAETPRMMTLTAGEWKQHWQELLLIIPTSHKNKWQYFIGGKSQFCVTSLLKHCAIKLKAAWSLIENLSRKGLVTTAVN